jgi:hypothetical protein
VEMTGRGKRGKPKSRFPTLSTALGNPAKSSGIPTFPQLRRRSLFLREGKAKASPNLQRPKVGQIKPPKWAKRSCQTQQRVSFG